MARSAAGASELTKVIVDNNPGIKKGALTMPPSKYGAGEESRTLDLNLGKVALYQLSYSRMGRYCNNVF